MAAKLALDDKLIEEARIVGKHTTKKAVVTEALKEYIQRRKQAEIIDLFHSAYYEPDCNYMKQRRKQGNARRINEEITRG